MNVNPAGRLKYLKSCLRGIFSPDEYAVAYFNKDFYVVIFDNQSKFLRIFRLKNIEKAREEMWKIKKGLNSQSTKYEMNEIPIDTKDYVKFLVRKLFGHKKIYIT